MPTPDPIVQVTKPAIDALYQISNPILVILLVAMLAAICILGYTIYKMYINFKSREDRRDDIYRTELKDKEKQLDDIYALMYKDSKTSLEFMITLENKFSEYIDISKQVGIDVKGLLVLSNTLKTQIEFMLKK